MIIGLFFYVIYIPVPEFDMPSLFVGLPIPKADESGNVAILTHIPVVGLDMVIFLFLSTLEIASFTLEWGFLLIITLPLLFALSAPLQLLVEKRSINIFCTFWYIIGLLILIVMLILFSAGLGLYCWLLGMFLLMVSRVKV